jgi:hypothetical protein
MWARSATSIRVNRPTSTDPRRVRPIHKLRTVPYIPYLNLYLTVIIRGQVVREKFFILIYYYLLFILKNHFTVRGGTTERRIFTVENCVC